MPIEYAPPRYVVIVNTIQERIADGTYPPGAMLPSETQLMREFGVSRPTVARALDLLRRDGWLDAHHGKGRFARAAPSARRGMPEHVASLLGADPATGPGDPPGGGVGGVAGVGEGDEVYAQVEVLDTAEVAAPARAAAGLGVELGAAVLARRWLVVADGVGPVELATAYLPVELAGRTGVSNTAPIREGLLRRLSARAGITFGEARQRVSARQATAEEAGLLEILRGDCVLTSLVSVCDRAGQVVFAVDAVYPPTRRELFDVFPVV